MADRFAVNVVGSINWDATTTTNWSSTDGGLGGASVPGPSDNANFTALSGIGTVTLTYSPIVTNCNFTGFTGTFVGGTNLISCAQWTASTTMTLNATGTTITVTGNNTFTTGGKTYNIVTLSSSAGLTISGAGAIFSALTCKNTSGYISFTVPSMTVGTLTLTGNNNSSQRISFGSQSYFTTATITVNTAVVLTNVDLMGVTRAGSASWSGTSLGNAGNNSATITFTTPKTVFWVQGILSSLDFLVDANFATSSGGAVSSANFPLPQDTCNFDVNSFTSSGKTVTCTTSQIRFPAMNFTGALNIPTFTPASPNYYGNLTLISGMTYTPSGTQSHSGLANAAITTAGQTLPALSLSYMPTQTLTMQDDMVSSASITWNIGGMSANNHNVTCTGFNSTGGSTRTLTMGSGTWTLTGTGAVWNFNGAFAPNVTINKGTSTIKLTNNSSSNKSFYGIGKTWNNFWNNTSGSGAVIIQDGSTFNNFKIDAGRTQQFVAGTTNTIASLTATGTSGNNIVISSTTSAQHTLSSPSIISCDYLTLSYSKAIGTGIFYAGSNSTDGGNNLGWNFVPAPTGQIKTLNGIPLGLIKTINGISRSNLKTYNGVLL